MNARKKFWIDTPLQLQILAFGLGLVIFALAITILSAFLGLDEAARASENAFHSLEWIRASLAGPFAIAAAVSLGAAALVSLIWSHRIAGPLRVLSAAMMRASRGEPQAQINLRSGDAHHGLIEDFSKMQEASSRRLVRSAKRLAEIKNRISDPDIRLEIEEIAQDLRAD